MGASRELYPEGSAVRVASKVFTEAETVPQQGWESFVATRIKEGSKGQMQLLLALAKAISKSKVNKLQSLRGVASTLAANFGKSEMWFQDKFGGEQVELGNLMVGHQSIPGEEIYHLLQALKGQFEPHTAVANDGRTFNDQPSNFDLVAVRFGYLPDVIFRVQVKHTDRNNTPVMDLGGTRAVDQILDRQSQVVELTAIPVLSADDSRIRPDPW